MENHSPFGNRNPSQESETHNLSSTCSNGLLTSEKELDVLDIFGNSQPFEKIQISYGNNWSAKDSNQNSRKNKQNVKRKEDKITQRKSKEGKGGIKKKKSQVNYKKRRLTPQNSKNSFIKKIKNHRSSLNIQISIPKKDIGIDNFISL